MEKVLCFFITLGCAKNEVDTDRMRALLLHAGYGMADSIEDAQVVIINTCSFLATAPTLLNKPATSLVSFKSSLYLLRALRVK